MNIESSLVRILIVDDHDIVRDGLADLIERERGMRVVGFASTGEEAVSVAQRLKPDLIIMDLRIASDPDHCSFGMPHA
jgi:DNA-binding NarL/FixJ family response regulator